MRTLENTPYLLPVGFDRAKALLAGTRLADLRWVPETGSTNADVRELLASEPERTEPIVLVTDHQTAGRGRRGRDWQAPPGTSLLMTIGLRADGLPAARRPLLGTALALAVHEVHPELSLKWPNDLVVAGAADDPLGYRKVGGLLAESHRLGDGDWVLLGIGLNVNWPEVPVELAEVATALDRVLGREVDREQLCADALGAFDRRWWDLAAGADPGELLAAYRVASATIGSRVRVELPTAELVGTATGITELGALQVLDDRGTVQVVEVGDVVHLRPTR
jgi:BirA family biotin operon repressor/biotin-[acetyl-CoA-carboxylase] ligase